jgi:tRNA pseudouridine32 synthase/23S rRNA pseudouridine746 synthase
MKRPDVFMSHQTRNGMTSSFVVTPTEIHWQTVTEFLLYRFPHLNPTALKNRIESGQIFYDDGSIVPADAPLTAHQRFWYFRENPAEPQIPFNYDILFEDENIIVVDKPHFLSTTPVGNFLKETVVTRLRHQTSNMDIAPAHRLDRATAGVLLLTKHKAAREPYQLLFQQRQVQKTYHAICHRNNQLNDEFSINVHMLEDQKSLFMRIEADNPNSFTDVTRLSQTEDFTFYQLKPITGKKHQLRCHMAHVNAGIVNDAWYPNAKRMAPDDFKNPLQLLAYELSFNDPFTQELRRFRTQRTLSLSHLFN